VNRILKLILLLSSLIASVMAQYVGSAVCGTCHRAKLDSQSKTGHAHALAPSPAGSPGQWAFGAGAKAITYVSQVGQENYLEHGLSYYPAIKAMAVTPGHSNTAGVRYPTFDAEATTLKCFRCHSTGPLSLGPGYEIRPSELGIRCESCHGPGSSHVKSLGAANSILNPRQLTAVELNELCGTCHRPPTEDDWTDPWRTRHQPAYLSQATCFRKSEGALSCLTCHDPHSPLSQRASDYDSRCTLCHPSVRHQTTLASKTCVECHMPQVKAGAQLHFTNHWIGIYGVGNKLVPSESRTRNVPPVARSGTQIGALDESLSLRNLFEEGLTRREKEFGPNDPRVASNASALGLFLSKTGHPAEAEVPLRKALEIDRMNKSTAVSADEENLALALDGAGRHEEAFGLFERAAQGPDPRVAARCLSILARLDPDHAEPYYRNALAAAVTAYGKNDSKVAVLLNDLALILQARKEYTSAESLFRRALAVQQQTLGADHPAAASTLSNLGTLLQAKGDLAQAEQMERSAVRIFEQKLGPASAELATACTNLADVLWSKKDFSSAAKLYRRAVSIDESVYGPDNPEVAGDLVNLGLVLKESGDLSASTQILRRALTINEKAFGPNSPQALQIKRELAVSAH
jgi:tetratricopeptide (TPR) repeat protein